MHGLQAQRSSRHQKMQAFRARRREEEEGPDAPILTRAIAEANWGKMILSFREATLKTRNSTLTIFYAVNL